MSKKANKTTAQLGIVDIMQRLRNSSGRFIGVHTKKGDSINAKFVSETDEYVTIFDRNSYKNRKLAKTSITSVSGR